MAQAATNVTLSDEAKAYLASLAQSVSSAQAPAATLAANARTWFDQQYQQLGISSAVLDGQVAVDMTGQSRATLSAVASNTQSLFTNDEAAVAGSALQVRFHDAIAPQAVIARHTGDYASLYDAAIKYMDAAGPGRASHDVLARPAPGAGRRPCLPAKITPGQAPDTGDANDPVRALLDNPTASGATSSDSSIESVAANARAMLDDQANAAKDNGKELVFNSSRKTGQQADLSQFDNRTLAAIAH